jgi:hypothetical protein
MSEACNTSFVVVGLCVRWAEERFGGVFEESKEV